jgi:hypothetical protein
MWLGPGVALPQAALQASVVYTGVVRTNEQRQWARNVFTRQAVQTLCEIIRLGFWLNFRVLGLGFGVSGLGSWGEGQGERGEEGEEGKGYRFRVGLGEFKAG